MNEGTTKTKGTHKWQSPFTISGRRGGNNKGGKRKKIKKEKRRRQTTTTTNRQIHVEKEHINNSTTAIGKDTDTDDGDGSENECMFE